MARHAAANKVDVGKPYSRGSFRSPAPAASFSVWISLFMTSVHKGFVMRCWFAALLVAASFAAPARAQDEIEAALARLGQAKLVYVAVVDEAKKELLVALEKHVKDVAASGDLDGVRTVIAAKENLERNGTIPDSPILEKVTEPFLAIQSKAAEALVKSYEATIREYTKALKIDQATALQKEMRAFQAGEFVVTIPKPEVKGPVDPIMARLDESKAEFGQAVKSAVTVALGRLDDRARELERLGNSAAAAQLRNTAAELAKNSTAESDDSAAKQALVVCARDITAAEKRLMLAYTQAISQAKRERKTELAEEIELDREDRELAKPQPGDSAGWFRLFRSTNPKVWNTTHRTLGERAVPVDRAPEDVKYLRLRLIDKQNYDVIIPIEKFYLQYTYRNDRYTWHGENTFDNDAYHLGIASGEFKLERNIHRGSIAIGPLGENTTFSGWGFGHRYRVGRGQGQAWQGRALAAQVLMEISVSAGPLTEAEKKLVLGGQP